MVLDSGHQMHFSKTHKNVPVYLSEPLTAAALLKQYHTPKIRNLGQCTRRSGCIWENRHIVKLDISMNNPTPMQRRKSSSHISNQQLNTEEIRMLTMSSTTTLEVFSKCPIVVYSTRTKGAATSWRTFHSYPQPLDDVCMLIQCSVCHYPHFQDN